MVKRLLITTILVFGFCSTAQSADFFVEGGVGLSDYQRTAPDGTWVQEGFPHHYDRRSLAMRAGVGLTLTPEWSVGVNVVDLGTVGVRTGFVADESYDPQAHQCVVACETARTVSTTDRLRGGELIGTYRPWDWVVAPFVRMGVAGFEHRLRWQVEQDAPATLSGIVLAGVAGAGLCYHNWLCADVSYYKGISTTKFPVSTAVVVPMLSLHYDF